MTNIEKKLNFIKCHPYYKEFKECFPKTETLQGFVKTLKSPRGMWRFIKNESLKTQLFEATPKTWHEAIKTVLPKLQMFHSMPWWSKFCINIKAQNCGPSKVYLFQKDYDPANLLKCSFLWAGTPEDFDYWNNQYSKLIGKPWSVEKESSKKPVTWNAVFRTTDTVVATVSYKDALATQPELNIDVVYDKFMEKLKEENIKYTFIRTNYDDLTFEAVKPEFAIALI